MSALYWYLYIKIIYVLFMFYLKLKKIKLCNEEKKECGLNGEIKILWK